MIEFATRTEVAARRLQYLRDRFDRRRNAADASPYVRGRCAETIRLLQMAELDASDEPLREAIVSEFPRSIEQIARLDTPEGRDSGEYAEALVTLARKVDGRFYWAELYRLIDLEEMIERSL